MEGIVLGEISGLEMPRGMS